MTPADLHRIAPLPPGWEWRIAGVLGEVWAHGAVTGRPGRRYIGEAFTRCADDVAEIGERAWRSCPEAAAFVVVYWLGWFLHGWAIGEEGSECWHGPLPSPTPLGENLGYAPHWLDCHEDECDGGAWIAGHECAEEWPACPVCKVPL